MTGDIRVTVPGRMDLPVKIAGIFSVTDIARVFVPVTLTFIAASPVDTTVDVGLLIAAVALGVAAVVWKPYGTPLDTHLRNAITLKLSGATVSSPVESVADGHVETRHGVVAVLTVSTTNLSLKTQRQQDALHTSHTDLFNMLDYPIEIRSEQHRIDLTTFIDKIRERVPDNLDQLRCSYINYLSALNDSDITVTTHYLAVTAADPVELDRRVARITNTVSGELSVTRLTGIDLAKYAAKHNYTGATTLFHTHQSPNQAVGDYNHQKTLIVTEQPHEATLAWPVDVLNVDGLVDVVQYVSPADYRETTNDLGRSIEKLEAEIISAQQTGRATTNRHEARIRDANWMLDKLADNQERPVTQQIAITVHDATEEAVEETLEHVKTRLDTMQVKYREPVLQQKAAFKTVNPLHYNPRTFDALLMPAFSAAGAFPFATTDAVQRHGVVYGEDATEGTPVILNRFDWSAGHTVVMGKTGSGKTFFQSLEIIRSLLTYPDIQVYILDPKQDYGELARWLGGVTVPATENAHVPPHQRVVSFTAMNRGDPENPKHLTAVLRKLYTAISNSQRPTLLVIDEAHNLLDLEDGKEVLTQVIREARDTNTAVTLLSQSADDFASSRRGRVILENTTGKVFFFHEQVPDSIIDQFGLSNSEVAELQNLEQGQNTPYSEAVIQVSDGVNAKIKVRATMPEHRLITTGAPRP